MASLRCLDFRLDPNTKTEDQWSPEGYSWYGDELIADRPSRYTAQKQIEIF
jgi:predicted metalloprotease with PDZ domain